MTMDTIVLRLQAASALREEARQWHRQCIRSRHISGTGPITTPSELTLVEYPVSPPAPALVPLETRALVS